MKFIGLFYIIITTVYGGLPVTITPRDGVVSAKPITGYDPSVCGTFIAHCGDIRAILGPQGKNIAVCRHGDVIAVIYGAPTNDPTNNPMAVKIAYSINQGANWTTYGPFSGNLRRIYGGVDAIPDFCTTPGGCVFCYMMRMSTGEPFPEHVIIEENVPSNPSPSAPITPFWSDSLYIWQPGIAIAPDDPLKMITHGWSYLSNGDNHLYCWVSTDGGCSWPTPIDMGVIINPAYGGNSGAKLRWGTGGYVAGIYINSVGGITNDGWPHFIETTDNGATWLSPVTLPVPHFDSTTGMFWWHEIDAEIVNNTPWVLANDISDNGGFWIFKGIGAPGRHTWQTYDADILGACSLYVGDTLFQIKPNQYGSICHDPVSGMTLVTYKAYGYIVQGGTNVLQDGPCVGGVFTYDDGLHWSVARPLSDWQVGTTWADWNDTETAHLLVNIHDTIYSYTIWIDNTTFDLYFERGMVQPILMTVAENNSSKPRIPMKLSPTVSRGAFRIEFSTATPVMTDLTLFDATGRQIANLFNGRIAAGPHMILADISHLPAGAYFIRLRSGTGSALEKILLIN
jgi:hypothetical protein